MSRSLNLSLTDELRAFLDANSGDGTLYATPSEFVRSLIREKRERMQAAQLRQAVLEGYDDLWRGRTLPLQADLRAMVAEGRRQDRSGFGR